MLNKDQLKMGKALNKQKDAFKKFLKELQQQQHNQSIDNSFEVRWSLQELENIVYDFINEQKGLPNEFKSTSQRPLEAKLDDIMKIQKRENDKDEMLPLFVRELILHDRGNSLYLSDSFANLPSPVNETQNLKQLFKQKDNDEDLNKNGGGRKKDKKDSNVEIRIEGKDLQHSSAKPEKNSEESFDKKANAKIDVSDIERIVFSKVNLSEMHHGIYSDPTQASSAAKKPGSEYIEEESYVNPTNLDSQSDLDFEDEKIKSIDG